MPRSTEDLIAAKGHLGIPADEPVFILRGQDNIATEILESWVRWAVMRGVPGDKVGGAVDILNAFREFARANPGRVKRPD